MTDTTEVTIEQLQEEVERLKSKNSELLTEKKKASGVTTDAQARIDALESEKSELEQRVYHFEVERPRLELIGRLTVSQATAETAMREILHRFDIGDDGALLNKDGSPLTIQQKDRDGDVIGNLPLKFDDDGIAALYEHDILPVLGHMLAGSKASGGGAPGSVGGGPLTPAPEDNNADSNDKSGAHSSLSFGIR